MEAQQPTVAEGPAARGLSHASAIYIIAAAASTLAPFIVLPLLSRWLGPAAFGIAANYLALVNVAVVLAGLSCHGLITVVHFKAGADAVPSHIAAALRLLGLTALPLLLLVAAGASFIAHHTGVTNLWLLSIVWVAVAQFVVSLALSVFQAREQPLRYAALQIGTNWGWAIVSLVAVGIFGLGWEGRALGQVAAVTAMALLAVLVFWRSGIWSHEAPATPLRTMVAFGLPLVPHSLAAAVLGSSDRLMLSGLEGREAAGQYALAFQIASVLTLGSAAINQAWVPWLYRRLASNGTAESRQVVRATYAIYVLIISGAAVLAITAGWVVPWLAGPEYTPAARLLQILAPAAAFSGMYYFVTNYLFFTARTGLLSAITIGCGALQLALLWFAIPRWGAEGAAAAVLVTACSYWIATWVAAQRARPMPWTTAITAQGMP